MAYAITMLRDRPTVNFGDDVSGAMAQKQANHGCALSNYCNHLEGNVSFYRMLSTQPWSTSGIHDNPKAISLYLVVSGVAKVIF